MKNLVFLFILSVILVSCGNQKKEATDQPEKGAVLTVDQLYQDASSLVDKEVVVKGTVLHVCKEGGVRCFLMGSNEDIIIRVEAGEDIGAFTQEQMGSDLEITGILKEVKSEAEAHNMMHGEAEAENTDEEMNSAHQAISNAQDSTAIVYFIEGLKSKEITKEI